MSLFEDRRAAAAGEPHIVRQARKEREIREHRIGVISDTHGLLRPEAIRVLQGSDLIVHAGDVGSPEVLTGLREVAPTVAVRGNIDKDQWAAALPFRDVVEVGDCLLYVIHELSDLDLDPSAAGFGAVIFGHTHKPLIERKGGVLFLNSGSAGPRRFTLPVAVAFLMVRGAELQAEIIELAL